MGSELTVRGQGKWADSEKWKEVSWQSPREASWQYRSRKGSWQRGWGKWADGERSRKVNWQWEVTGCELTEVKESDLIERGNGKWANGIKWRESTEAKWDDRKRWIELKWKLKSGDRDEMRSTERWNETVWQMNWSNGWSEIRWLREIVRQQWKLKSASENETDHHVLCDFSGYHLRLAEASSFWDHPCFFRLQSGKKK